MRRILNVETPKYFIKTHIAFWLFWTTISAVLNFWAKEDFTVGLLAFRVLFVNILPFYSVYLALKLSKNADKVNYALRFILLLFGMGISYGSHWFYFIYVTPHTADMPQVAITAKMMIVSFIANYLYFFLFGLMFYFFEDLVRKKEIAKNAENKRFEAETAFLRAQINPHFLLNTLNFFYASATMGKSKELADGILKLSDIMRFSLTKNNEMVISLIDEVKFIKSYIALNQMRFNNEISVLLKLPSEDEIIDVKIVPLVLMTLVENAFKHGEMLDKEDPLVISLDINRDKKELLFYTKNKKMLGAKQGGHGIGVENTKARLNAEYGNNYQFSIIENLSHYEATLKIQSEKLWDKI